ncbi:sigma-54-dependent Fis family transcriptional regulator [Kroppenstedtia guangzhouensis]|uniref:Sigma-54-dependent Fis family transcriptional regulator n=2 Tax=Kroppenstedtia guangzhouensis TaxID=1274356 RepID=A0ABQ1GHB7_9BACL|nr:sigma-54-dependent Fis family transcriptional regulator [Kroppenstedtia guangzhouensis]
MNRDRSPWSFFHSHACGIYVADHQGNTLYVNPAYEKISGIPSEEVVGRNLKDLVESGYYNRSTTLSVLEQKQPVHIQQIIQGKKEVFATGSPVVDTRGNVQMVITVVEPKSSVTIFKSGESGMVADSPAMQELLKTAGKVAAFDIPVLIQGETGTGKEVLSQWIHQRSRRKNGPFLAVNCAILSHHLLDSELFGYGKGAFTGAEREGKKGLLEAASGGTLFLDEIGDMPYQTQVKLLRALENQKIRRIGETQDRNIDIRLILATNRDLFSLVQKGTFRADLYYRIEGIQLKIPPLRERRTDIPLLARHFWKKNIQKYGWAKAFSPEAATLLKEYEWPGNIRQLRNFIEQLYILSEQSLHLDQVMKIMEQMKTHKAGTSSSLKEQVRRFERERIKEVLAETGSAREAARVLGINPSTLFRKLKG